jgi:hypothetical protein
MSHGYILLTPNLSNLTDLTATAQIRSDQVNSNTAEDEEATVHQITPATKVTPTQS